MNSTLSDILAVLMIIRFEAKRKLPRSSSKSKSSSDDKSSEGEEELIRQLRDEAAGKREFN